MAVLCSFQPTVHLKHRRFPTNHWRFPIKHGSFPTKHGCFLIKHGRFKPTGAALEGRCLRPRRRRRRRRRCDRAALHRGSPRHRRSWLNMAPTLSEYTAPSPKPACLEAWAAPVCSPERSRGRLQVIVGLAQRQQARPDSPSTWRLSGTFPINRGRFPIKHGRLQPGGAAASHGDDECAAAAVGGVAPSADGPGGGEGWRVLSVSGQWVLPDGTICSEEVLWTDERNQPGCDQSAETAGASRT
jgi:hypothetical protein